MAKTLTARQRAWRDAAEEDARRGNSVAAGLFGLLSLPSDSEREGHDCGEHALPHSRAAMKCGICGAEVPFARASKGEA